MKLEFQLRKITRENYVSASDNRHPHSLVNIKSGNILPRLSKIKVSKSKKSLKIRFFKNSEKSFQETNWHGQ